jgi:hypothetical protein
MTNLWRIITQKFQHKEEKIMAENDPQSPPAARSPDLTQRVVELEAVLAARNEELSKAGARLAELEKAAAGAVSSYKAVIVQANPDVLPELITGQSIEALDASLAKARELIGKVKTGLEAQKAANRIPAGAPPRAGADTGSLSSREKIRQGVEKARGK